MGSPLPRRGADDRARLAAHHPYREWIDTYASPAFEELAATLESLLERYAEDRQTVRSVYRRAMQLEVAFFGAHAPSKVA
jgi:thiaminase/transcriptional activator TenA